jgi:hypothetical protein
MNDEYESRVATQVVGGQTEQGRPGMGRPFDALVLFLARLFAGAFAGQCSLHALLFAGLQVKGVTLDLLNDVFLLHFSFKPAQCIFEGFALLKSYFRQTDTPPNWSGRTR